MKRKTFSRKGKGKARKVEKPPNKVDVTPSSSHQQDDSEVREKTPYTEQSSTDVLGNTSLAQQQPLQDHQSTTAGDMSEYMSIML